MAKKAAIQPVAEPPAKKRGKAKAKALAPINTTSGKGADGRKRIPDTAGAWIRDVCTKGDMAILLNMNIRNVTDQTARGILVPAAKRGMYSTLSSLHAYIDRIREVAAGRSKDTTTPLAEERIKTEKVERELVEYKLAQIKGEILTLSEVSESWTVFTASLKSKVLSIPTKVRSRIPHLTAHDQEEIRNIVLDILNEAADEIEASVIGGEADDLRS